MKLKKGDKVIVIAGKDKGRTGVIKRVILKKQAVVIEKINIVKKHIKPAKGQKGGIIELEKPLFVGKIMLVCPHCTKPTRVGYQLDKKGEKYRICRKCQSLLK